MGEVGSLLRHGSTNEGGQVCTGFIRSAPGKYQGYLLTLRMLDSPSQAYMEDFWKA